MSFEKISALLTLHQEWLDSAGTSGRRATYLGKRVPTPNFFTHDNRQVFVPGLAPRDDLIFTDADLLALRGFHNYPLPPLNLAKSDFRGADFHSIDLRKANFTGADLQKSIFKGTSLESTSFASAQLSEALFSECSIRDVNCDSAALEGARFSHVECFDSTFANANLQNSFIEDSLFETTSLCNANLGKRTFTRANFENVNLQKAILARSLIDDCRFRHANFRDTIAPYLHIRAAGFKTIQASRSLFCFCWFENCELDDCDAAHTNYAGSVFEGVRIANSNLRSTRFQGTSLKRVSFVSSNLSFADFSDLSGVTKIWITDQKVAGGSEYSFDDYMKSTHTSAAERIQRVMEKKYVHVPETYVTVFEETRWSHCNMVKMRITEDALSSIADDDMEKTREQLDIIREGNEPRKCKVFLCYAREDEAAVTEFYIELKKHKDMEPWMDRTKLRVGQKWDDVIKREIKQSDFFVVFLSNRSVEKKGYVQIEFKVAVIAQALGMRAG